MAEAGQYNPVEYDTWPRAQQEAASTAYNAGINGDLKPLAQYIRAGYYLEPALAAFVADVLDGSDVSYTARLVAKRPGYKGFDRETELYDRKMAIGVFMETQLRLLPRGSYDSVLAVVRERFGVGPSVAAEALKHVRLTLQSAEVRPGFDLFAHWQDIYSGRFEK